MYIKLLALIMTLALAGCTSSLLNEKQSEALSAMSRATLTGTAPQASNTVRVVDKVVLPMIAIKDEASNIWLTDKRVRLVNNKRRALNLAEVVKMFFDQGINISSSIPLDGYTYAGLGIQDADAEMALRSILGAVGLDYELDEVGKTVLIRPMASRSWKINLGDRKTSFGSNSHGGGTAGVSAFVPTQQNTSSQSGGIQSGAGGTGQQVSGQVSSSESQTNGSLNAGGTNGATISSNDDFWTSFKIELKDRMEVLLPGVATSPSDMISQLQSVPVPMPLLGIGVPGAHGSVSRADGQTVEFYIKKRIGTFAINPVTGYVTVQAPRWLLNDLDKYIKRIQAEYNYRITFVGEMVLVTTNDSNSEGLDISAFGRFAQSRYGVAFSSNALGGVTVNFPGSGAIPSINAGGQPLAGTLLGVRSSLDGLQVFNAYLQNYGTVNVIQRPILVTSNGVPGYFSRTSRKYFVQYNQVTAAGNAGAATVGTQNQLIPFDFGTTLTIYPRYDSEADLVRADIILDQVVQSGTQSVPQQVSSGSGIQQVNQDIPLPATFKYRGEVLLRDGDLIVIGGQSDDEINSTDSGITGLKNSPFGAIFGQKTSTKSIGTYYFALRVKLTKTD